MAQVLTAGHGSSPTAAGASDGRVVVSWPDHHEQAPPHRRRGRRHGPGSRQCDGHAPGPPQRDLMRSAAIDRRPALLSPGCLGDAARAPDLRGKLASRTSAFALRAFPESAIGSATFRSPAIRVRSRPVRPRRGRARNGLCISNCRLCTGRPAPPPFGERRDHGGAERLTSAKRPEAAVVRKQKCREVADIVARVLLVRESRRLVSPGSRAQVPPDQHRGPTLLPYRRNDAVHSSVVSAAAGRPPRQRSNVCRIAGDRAAG